jgi:hypothetical protein
MFENEHFQQVDRDEKHESWLALKAAYENYQISFRLLESMIAQQSEDSVAVSGRMIEVQQRAFEQYIEARMNFMECCVDETKEASIRPAFAARDTATTRLAAQPGKTVHFGVDWAPFANRMLILRILPLVLLCVTSISVILQQKHTSELQATLHDLQGRLEQVRGAAASAGEALPPGGPVMNAKTAVQPPPAADNPVPSGQSSPGSEKKVVPTTKVQAPTLRDFGMPLFYPFTLPASHQFQRVGPIRVSIAAIDPKRAFVKLSVVTDFSRLDLPQLRANQPVWIPMGHYQKPVEFVIDRIGATSLEGHLGDPRNRKVELRASRAAPKSNWRSTE